MKKVPFFSLAVLFSECHSAEDQRLFQTPTATEVFNLRTRCAALAQKLLEGNRIETAFSKTETSHYDVKSNRCFVQLTVSDPTTDTFYGKYLHDGQTGELLAYATDEHGKQSTYLKSTSSLGSTDKDYFAVVSRIEHLMADDQLP